MINNLQNKINEIYYTPGDINEHIPTLIRFGEQCEHITEMGVRGICSTWAFLGAMPKRMVSYDLENPSNWGGVIQDVYDTAKHYGIDYEFIKDNVLAVEIEETDLLFLDTWHVYEQVRDELKLHASKVKQYILFHDTISWGEKGETPGYEGINRAINEFLMEHDEWIIQDRYDNNNGLLVLRRIKFK